MSGHDKLCMNQDDTSTATARTGLVEDDQKSTNSTSTTKVEDTTSKNARRIIPQAEGKGDISTATASSSGKRHRNTNSVGSSSSTSSMGSSSVGSVRNMNVSSHLARGSWPVDTLVCMVGADSLLTPLTRRLFKYWRLLASYCKIMNPEDSYLDSFNQENLHHLFLGLPYRYRKGNKFEDCGVSFDKKSEHNGFRGVGIHGFGKSFEDAEGRFLFGLREECVCDLKAEHLNDENSKSAFLVEVETIPLKQLEDVKVVILIQSDTVESEDGQHENMLFFGGKHENELCAWLCSLPNLRFVILHGCETENFGNLLVKNTKSENLNVLCWKTRVLVNYCLTMPDADFLLTFLESLIRGGNNVQSPLRLAIDKFETKVKCMDGVYQRSYCFQEPGKVEPKSIGLPVLLSSDPTINLQYELANKLDLDMWAKQSKHVRLYINGLILAAYELERQLELFDVRKMQLDPDYENYLQLSTVYQFGSVMGWICHIDLFFGQDQNELKNYTDPIKVQLEKMSPNWKQIGSAMIREWHTPPSIMPYIKFQRRIHSRDGMYVHFKREYNSLLEMYKRVTDEKDIEMRQIVTTLRRVLFTMVNTEIGRKKAINR